MMPVVSRWMDPVGRRFVMSSFGSAPRVAMFLSADIVGSTAFKRSLVDASGRPHWLEAFETLFSELPLMFIGQVAEAGAVYDRVPECGVWKVLGDEVIFIGLPTSVVEAEILAAAFVRTVAAADRAVADRWPLRLRGACWAAELGDRNRMIEIPEMLSGQPGQPYLDFLGPDVDLGFRLGPHSAPGHVIVSPNLAEALIAPAASNRLRFHPAGERVLKGVAGGFPIPLILMACDPGAVGAPAGHPAANPIELRAAWAARRRALPLASIAAMAPPVFASAEPAGTPAPAPAPAQPDSAA